MTAAVLVAALFVVVPVTGVAVVQRKIRRREEARWLEALLGPMRTQLLALAASVGSAMVEPMQKVAAAFGAFARAFNAEDGKR